MLYIPGKIPVRIYPFFWIVALLIGWMSSFANASSIQTALLHLALWVFVITFSVLIHEYGHALSAMAFGQKAKIELIGFGGVTYRSGPKLKLWKEFVIVLCGPLFGMVLAIISFILFEKMAERPMSVMLYTLQLLFNVNFFWTLVNLLPVQPLDGGRLLSIVLEGIFGIRGVKIAFFLSIVIAAVVGIFFFAIQAVLPGSLFFILAFESYRSWKSSLYMHDQDQNEDVKNLFHQGEEDFRAGHQEAALEKFREVRRQTQSGVLYNLATNYEALLLKEKGDYKNAYEILLPIKNKLDLSAWNTLQQLAYQNKDWNEVIQLGNRIFNESPSYGVAFLNALSYAALHQAKPAVGWLRSALREGMPHFEVMLSKTEFDPIRQSEEFRALMESKMKL